MAKFSGISDKYPSNNIASLNDFSTFWSNNVWSIYFWGINVTTMLTA